MKFLTDAQARQAFAEMLKKLGHEVTTAAEQGLHKEKDDARLVAWARIHNHTFITFDHLRGYSARDVAQEIKLNGGRVILIGGGPEQEPERALGKILYHWQTWSGYFEQEDGLVQISDLKKPKFFPRSEIEYRVRGMDRPLLQEYVRERQEARKRPLKRSKRRKADPQQQEFDVSGGAA